MDCLLFLFRHGETDWNLQHRLQGWTDRPLDDTGRKQGAALAETLKGIHLDAIYSSTLSRSRDTAQMVAGNAMTVKILDGLRELEVDLGLIRRRHAVAHVVEDLQHELRVGRERHPHDAVG